MKTLLVLLFGAATLAGCGGSVKGTTAGAAADAGEAGSYGNSGIAANCLLFSDAGAPLNQPCADDSDCPSGQRCGAGLGGDGEVCSVACSDAGTCPLGGECRQFVP